MVSEQTALLLDETSPETIAEAIVELQRNPDRRQRLALNGLRLFQERFAYEKHLDQWEKLLNTVASGKWLESRHGGLNELLG